jgi:hypothetical protein
MTSVVVLPFFFIVLCLAAIIDMNEAAKKAKGVKR